MIRTSAAPMLGVIALAATLTGCASLLTGKAPPFLLSLASDQTPATGTQRVARAAEALSVVTPVVPAKLRTTRVPVQADAATIAYVKDAQWVEAPARLFQRLVANTIAARTGRLVVDPDTQVGGAGPILSGQLVEFGLDARTNEAIVVYEAVLSGEAASIRAQRFEAREPVAAIDARTVGGALERAANRVAGEVAAFVG